MTKLFVIDLYKFLRSQDWAILSSEKTLRCAIPLCFFSSHSKRHDKVEASHLVHSCYSHNLNTNKPLKKYHPSKQCQWSDRTNLQADPKLWDLCAHYLKADPRSSNADVRELALIMVDAMKAKANITLGKIHQLLHQGKPSKGRIGCMC